MQAGGESRRVGSGKMTESTIKEVDLETDPEQGIKEALTRNKNMREKRAESVDFVKDFQEYLTQQTQHVNMISGSVCNEKEPELLQPAGTENHQNGIHHASVEVSLDDGSGMIGEGPERTPDGKLKCQYCNYASKGIARLMEHTRMHTGEKPHRCHLCPFASAYERHLEAHMRSHRGEKPYKCELCSFRCSDQSNLSHHRRRRHKLLPLKGRRTSLSNKRMMGILQKKSSFSLSYGRRSLINLSPPSMLMHKSDYLNDFTHNISTESYDGFSKVQSGIITRDVQDMMVDNPLNQLSALAGQLSSLARENQAPVSPEDITCRDEKPFVIHQSTAPVVSTVVSTMAQTSFSASPDGHAMHNQRNFSPLAGPSSERSAHMSSPCITNSQPSTPVPAIQGQDPQLLHHCQHCDMYFADNILYTIHMGCHGYENPFQCNICGCKCKNQYDFACHFARGQHKQN
ncbi:zinc finger protein Pegasus isoform X1 [Callorhinchus milii]|uniref:Zinc finger protein Pegasus n=1 Tax=Callorhinchus milii TaxID=7868 RepID=A0A4W3HK52_CALMI|nr:zinc finger protein Pegasus isoform X1 [Callorhinchus milii]|eukprot:gi/632971336/ref/XP_007902121.1/ PREDICTED: zinc finger protein Pegasus-like [Callorhinchus milii]